MDYFPVDRTRHRRAGIHYRDICCPRRDWKKRQCDGCDFSWFPFFGYHFYGTLFWRRLPLSEQLRYGPVGRLVACSGHCGRRCVACHFDRPPDGVFHRYGIKTGQGYQESGGHRPGYVDLAGCFGRIRIIGLVCACSCADHRCFHFHYGYCARADRNTTN